MGPPVTTVALTEVRGLAPAQATPAELEARTEELGASAWRATEEREPEGAEAAAGTAVSAARLAG